MNIQIDVEYDAYKVLEAELKEKHTEHIMINTTGKYAKYFVLDSDDVALYIYGPWRKLELTKRAPLTPAIHPEDC